MAGHEASVAWVRELTAREKDARTPSDDFPREQVRTLRRKLGLSLMVMLSACAAAWLVVPRAAGYPLTGGQYGAASAFVFAWAGLARLGWAGQSWKGDTPVERVDAALFQALCWVGMYLATAAVV